MHFLNVDAERDICRADGIAICDSAGRLGASVEQVASEHRLRYDGHDPTRASQPGGAVESWNEMLLFVAAARLLAVVGTNRCFGGVEAKAAAGGSQLSSRSP